MAVVTDSVLGAVVPETWEPKAEVYEIYLEVGPKRMVMVTAIPKVSAETAAPEISAEA